MNPNPRFDPDGPGACETGGVYLCVECGFEHELTAAPRTADLIPEHAAAFAQVLRGGADPATRRDPAVWSPLEYGCHLRDMFIVQRERVLLALRADRPFVVPMGRAERVQHDGYADQDPDDVVRQLTECAALLGHLLGRLTEESWGRTLVYNYPDRAERSLAWLAVHTLHEAVHHTHDIRRQLG